MTEQQENALREYLQESIVPLIEQVLVKKLGQAMSYAATELLQLKTEPVIDKSAAVRIATSLGWEPKRTWIGLTDEEKQKFVIAYYPSNWDKKTAVVLMNNYEAYLKEKNHG